MMMMMIAPKSHARREENRGGQLGEEEGNADCGGMVQLSQQHVAPCVKEVEWGLGTTCLRVLAAFSAVIPVELHRRQA